MTDDDSSQKKAPHFNMDALRKAMQGEGASSGATDEGGVAFDGFAAVTEMFRHMDEETKEKILGNVAAQDPTLVARIRQNLVSFDDLQFVDASGIQRLVQEVPRMKWVVSMRKVSDSLKKHLFQCLSQRAQEALKEEIENLGPQQLSTVHAAQKDVMEVAQRLEKEGHLKFIRPEGDAGDPWVK